MCEIFFVFSSSIVFFACCFAVAMNPGPQSSGCCGSGSLVTHDQLPSVTHALFGAAIHGDSEAARQEPDTGRKREKQTAKMAEISCPAQLADKPNEIYELFIENQAKFTTVIIP